MYRVVAPITGSSGLLDVDELREVLDVGEHGVLLHHQVVPSHQQPHQLLIERLYLGQEVVLYELQLGHVQPGQGSSVELKEGQLGCIMETISLYKTHRLFGLQHRTINEEHLT